MSEDALRRWFEPRRAQYEHAARFDFEEALLSRDKSEPAVRALVETLNRAENADSHAGLRVFKGRPESNVVQSYGRELAKELARSEPGRWRALRSRDGFRAMRLLAMTPARPAVFETLRETLRRDWTEAMVAEKRAAAVRALWKNYQIEFAEKHRCVADE